MAFMAGVVQSQEDIYQHEARAKIGMPEACERFIARAPQPIEVDHTGQVNLSIPLFDVPGRGGLNFPLTALYHSGIREFQESSWIGLGWSLDIGSVTRKIVFKADYFPHNAFLEYPDAFKVSSPWGEGQIDNFGDYTAANYQFELYKAWKIMPTIINVNASGNDPEDGKDITQFIMTTEDGIRLIFDKALPGWSVFYLPDQNYPNGDMSYGNNEWLLTAVLGSDYAGYNGNIHPLDAPNPSIDNQGSWIAITYQYSPGVLQNHLEYVDPNNSVKLTHSITATYPFRIVTPTHVAEFSYSEDDDYMSRYEVLAPPQGDPRMSNDPEQRNPLWELNDQPSEKKMRLDNIKLFRYGGTGSSHDNSAIKEIDFGYAAGAQALAPMDMENAQGKTTLVAINFKDGRTGVNLFPPYSFDYGAANPKTLPNADNIGGFLGAIIKADPTFGNYTTFPYKIYETYYRAPGTKTKYVNTSCASGDDTVWNLYKITYPGGGTVRLMYGDSKYHWENPAYSHWDPNSLNQDYWVRGGVGRVVSEFVSDGRNAEAEYDYKYGEYYNLNSPDYDNDEHGHMYLPPSLYFADLNFASCSGCRNLFFDPSDEYLGYDRITEILPAGNGKIIRYFTSGKDNQIQIHIHYPDDNFVYQNTLYLRGLLTKEEKYNSSGILVKKDEYTYSENIKYVCKPNNGTDPMAFSVAPNHTDLTTVIYDESGNNCLQNEVTTYYDADGLVNKIDEKKSDSQLRETRYTHPGDFVISSGTTDPGAQAIKMLQSKNMLSSIIGTDIYDLGKAPYDSSHCTIEKSEFIKYDRFSMGINSTDPFVKPIEKWDLNVTKPCLSSTVTRLFFAPSSQQLQYDARYQANEHGICYDSYGNCTKSVDANGEPSATKWGHHATEPIAAFKNAADVETFTDGFDGDHDQWDGMINMDGQHYFSELSTLLPAGGIVPSGIKYNGTASFQMNNSDGYDSSIEIYPKNNIVVFPGKTYIVSCMVKGQDILNDGGAGLRVTLLNGIGGTVGTPTTTSLNGTFDWTKFSQTIVIPSIGVYSMKLTLFLHGYYPIATVWFDDVQIYPVGALCTFRTFDPENEKITSETDANGKTTFYSYDAFGRLLTIKDNAQNLLTDFQYGYSRSRNPQGVFDPADPNDQIERSYRSTAPGDYTSRTVFSDGNGSEIETAIAHGTSDIINAQVLDRFGRVAKRYKAYETSLPDPHTFDNHPDAAANSYYPQAGGWAYSELSYDTSPIDRLKNQSNPGVTFNKESGHDIEYTYILNSANDVSGYQVKTLLKKLRRDENQKISCEFTDTWGKTIAGIADYGGLNLLTKFDYDATGNLVQSTNPGSLHANYLYNTLQQLVQKSSPDAGTIRYRYDANGNVRFIQDANHAAMNPPAIVYRKYDIFSRLVEEGEYVLGSSETFQNINSATTGIATGDFPPVGACKKAQCLVYDNVSLSGSGQSNLMDRLSCCQAYRDGVLSLTTWYSYDDMGRIAWVRHAYFANQTWQKKISYWYDLQGNVTKKKFEDITNGDNTLYTFYDYDQAGRLYKVSTNQTDSDNGKLQEALYTYYPTGLVKRVQLGNAQGMDYTYTERDWLKGINSQQQGNGWGDPGNDGAGGAAVPHTDLFTMNFGYNDAAQNALPQFNGNISWLRYTMAGIPYIGPAGPSDTTGWSYSYDNVNRLTDAVFGYYINAGWIPTNKYDVRNCTYDNSGNILTLYRALSSFTNISTAYNYQYSNNSNRLVSVWSEEFNRQFQYDANGNMTMDSFAGINSIAYDIHNLPIALLTSGLPTYYTYDMGGNRIRKQNGQTDQLYVLGAGGETEAVYDANNGKLHFWNIIAGKDVIGRIQRP